MEKIKLLIPALAASLILAACGAGETPGGDGPPDDPGPGPESIHGHLAAPSGFTLLGSTIALCESGSTCSAPLATIDVNVDRTETAFEFHNVPSGIYDLMAYSPPLGTTPESRFVASETGVASGTSFVVLEMELQAERPADGSASMTGTIHLPGSINTAAQPGNAPRLSAGAELVEPITASSLIPAGELALLQSGDLNSGRQPEAVPGEVIVRFEQEVLFSQSTLGTLSVDGIALQHTQGTPGGMHLYESTANLDLTETVALANELSAQPGVRSAAPNWILHSFAEPDDPLYPLQWHYDVVNMESAWDRETGSRSVTVAVVDSGSIDHDDLAFTGGYNFISDPARAGNSYGRGSDPIDMGDGSNYHGAHVAGTVGAATDNGLGIAGINWNVTLVPIRVLGRGGNGATFDILDGITWAAGGAVSGVPYDNRHPAQIVNLSLGANLGQSCSNVLGGDDSFFQDLTNEFGTIFVVAAGNDDTNTNGVFPANCPGVITVGATGVGTSAAPYSNFGNEVDVFAPGGDLTASFTVSGQTYPYGVLSTVLQPNGSDGYAFFQGTSMAAPHIAGIIALMLADEPGLSQSTVLHRIQDSARQTVSKRGYGNVPLADAAAALLYTGGGTPPPPPPPPPAGDVVTYILFSTCLDSSCADREPYQFAAFEEPVPGGHPYLVSNLSPGRYFVESWMDLDGTSDPLAGIINIAPEDPYDAYPLPVTLRANQTTSGIDLHLDGSIDD